MTHQARIQRLREATRLSHRRSLAAVVAAAVICGAILWLSFAQRRALEHGLESLAALRTARADLARGAMDVALALPGSGSDASQGLARITQAVDGVERAELNLAAPAAPVEGQAEVRRRVAELQQALAEGSARGAEADAALMAAIATFDRRAAALDARMRRELEDATRQADVTFGVALTVASVLLAMLALLLVTAERSLHVIFRDWRETDRELMAVFDALPALIWFKGRDNRIRRVNARAAEVAGRAADDIEGLPAAEVFAAEVARSEADDHAILDSGVPTLGTLEHLPMPAGTRRWYRIDRVAYHGADGATDGLLVVARDVTELKRTDDSLLDERNRLAALAAAAPTVLCSFRQAPDGAISFPYASPKIEEFYGLTPAELALDAASVVTFWHPDDRARVLSNIDVSRRTMTPWREEFRVVHPVRGDIWVEGHSVPFRDPDGGTTWHGAVTDITDRKRAEGAIEERLGLEERLSALAAMSPTGMYAFRLGPDEAMSFPYASVRFEEMFGISAATLAASADPALALIHPDDQARVIESIRRSARDGTPWVEELRVQHPTRGTLWVEGRARPTRQPDGSTLWYGALVDVTDRHQLEAELLQAQKMEAIGRLAGGVAHDFNNLLTVILGNATQLLEDAPARDEAREIINASERAANLTKQLLLFSRKQVMQQRDLDLNAVLGDMTRMLQRILGEDITLRSEFASALPAVHADPGMMEQVLLNLAVNSRDAMPHGGELHVATRMSAAGAVDGRRPAELGDGDYVCMSVRDTGSGIAPDTLARIFEPFFTTKEPGKGTGLGLSTVYGIVAQHGGRVVVQSAVGAGTTFHVFLPAVTAPARDLPPAADSAVARVGNAECLLVVEDESAVRDLAARLLRRSGYRVLTASSGAEALDVWRAHGAGIALLMTDLVMPGGMTGFALAARLSADCPALPVIFTSGYSRELSAGDVTLVPGFDFLEKPYRVAQLLSIVRRRLDAARDEPFPSPPAPWADISAAPPS